MTRRSKTVVLVLVSVVSSLLVACWIYYLQLDRLVGARKLAMEGDPTIQEQLTSLLQKRADEVMEIDRSPMSESEIRMHSEDSGEEFVANRLREGFWFSYPALLRIALELEYGKSYEEYADKRDGIT